MKTMSWMTLPQLRALIGSQHILALGAVAWMMTFGAAPASSQDRYLAFGDSITQATGFDDCPLTEQGLCGYPIRLEERFSMDGQNIPVENHGKGGERTPAGVTRINTVLNSTGAGPGDVVLLMEGTNDITRSILPEDTLFNLDEMANRVESRGAEAIHATLIPRFPQANVDPENLLTRNMGRSIRELAYGRSRMLVDPFEVFFQKPNLFTTYYHDPDDLPFSDPVGHPNPDGFDLLTDVFYEALTQATDTVPPVIGEVIPVDGSVDISPLAPVRVRLYDFGTGVDPLAAGMTLNGFPVAVDVSNSGQEWLDVIHFPTGSGLAGTVEVRVQGADLANPANTMDRLVGTFDVDVSGPDPCLPDENTLCIDHRPGDRRFRVRLDWQTSLNGGLSGQAVVTPLDTLGFASGGLLSFFEGTPEALVKVLDACSFGNFWVFAALTTTLGFDLVIEDTVAKAQGAPVSQYRYEVHNLDGDVAQPVADVNAFDTCGFNLP